MMIDTSLVAGENETRTADLKRDYETLGERLDRRGVSIDAIKAKVAAYGVAVPSWGVGTGGTRFARFPGKGEPRHIFDKLEDCSVIQQLTRATPNVSLHIPWDKADPAELKAKASSLGLGFDAMNSNTFQDQDGQPLSYKFGSLSHTDAGTRRQAVEHNLECIEIGKAIGSRALTIWIGDGSNFPGQTHFTRQFERYLDAAKAIYAELPDDWRLFTEHKMYEPAFYSTVVQDWGTNYMIAQELGEKAYCLVDLGHHAPNANIEMIVARLIQFGKLGGFHFNDSKYGDDDLDTGSIDPYSPFLFANMAAVFFCEALSEVEESGQRSAESGPRDPRDPKGPKGSQGTQGIPRVISHEGHLGHGNQETNPGGPMARCFTKRFWHVLAKELAITGCAMQKFKRDSWKERRHRRVDGRMD